jgi:hypothetical protein
MVLLSVASPGLISLRRVLIPSCVQNAINVTFGGTLLATPALDVVNCIIGSKIQSLQSALTFLQQFVPFPRFCSFR